MIKKSGFASLGFILISIFLGGVLLFLSTSEVRSAPASILYVGTKAGCTTHSIKSAIALANPGDTIRVEAKTFHETPIAINKNLTILGGYTASGSCLSDTVSGKTTINPVTPSSSRMIGLASATVVMRNFVVSGNTSGGGLHVFQSAILTLEDVTISGNHAASGGGMMVENARLICTDCTFAQNKATTGNGGGLRIIGDTSLAIGSLRRVVFSNNTAVGDGGGMSIEKRANVSSYEMLRIGGNWSDTNHADGNGGGIAMTGVVGKQPVFTLNASPSSLSSIGSNEANLDGGGIYVSRGTVILNGVLGGCNTEMIGFNSNKADNDNNHSGNGGAIYAAQHASVSMTKTKIRRNKAYNGGGVACDGCVLNGEDVVVSDNDASSLGGGVFVDHQAVVALVNGKLNKNESANSGGGIFVQGESRLELDGSGVNLNTTQNLGTGGGITAVHTNTEILISNSTIATNTTGFRGGGLELSDGVSVTIRNTRIFSNSMKTTFIGVGGGIDANNDVALTIERSDIFRNTTRTRGAGIFLYKSNLRAEHVTISSNVSRGSGGGISMNGSSAVLTNCEMVSNEVPEDGGAILALGTGNELHMADCLVKNNYANFSHGGGLVFGDGVVDIERSQFLTNVSKKGGGAMFIQGVNAKTTVTMTNNVFMNNYSMSSATLSPDSPEAAGGSSINFNKVNAILRHNTINKTASGETFGIVIGDEASVLLKNNIIGNFYVGIQQPTGSTGTGTTDYTLFYGNTQNYDTTINSTHEISNGNPAFAGTMDFHLTSGSEAIDAGMDAGVHEDLDGHKRPFGSAPDIGAYEYGYVIYIPCIMR